MSIIATDLLTKYFHVSEKEPGLIGTFNHLFTRKTKKIYAVDKISFNIEPGEIVGFIGPNGAGKTTTLKMLCGLVHPSSGNLCVSGHIPHLRKKNYLNQITLVMGQKQQLIWDLSPIDSLMVNASIYCIDDLEMKRRISTLAEMLELDRQLYKPVRKLSLGERMKAELLAALLHKPKILFLDEPTLGLDINSQVRIRKFLIEYNRLYKATILISSHYMADITSLCKRVILINKGRIFYDGYLKELANKYSFYKKIVLEFDQYINSIESLSSLGHIVDSKKNIITINIHNDKVIDSLKYIINNYSIKDINVTEPSIEEMIGKVFNNE